MSTRPPGTPTAPDRFTPGREPCGCLACPECGCACAHRSGLCACCRAGLHDGSCGPAPSYLVALPGGLP
jgi:hypothetical protein